MMNAMAWTFLYLFVGAIVLNLMGINTEEDGWTSYLIGLILYPIIFAVSVIQVIITMGDS